MPASKVAKVGQASKSKNTLRQLVNFDIKTYTSAHKELLLPEAKVTGGKAFINSRQISLFSEQAVLIGVDEVGRGCLAGPVVSAAVALPFSDLDKELKKALSQLDDSKKLAKEVREELSQILKDRARFAIGQASAREIDDINILNASLLSMHRAVATLLDGLSLTYEQVLVLVDGNKKIKEERMKQLTVIKGDSQSASIASASVIAKVFRDNHMFELSQLYPNYGFEGHKGYPALSHRQAIRTHGPCAEHRMSFRLLPQTDLEQDLMYVPVD